MQTEEPAEAGAPEGVQTEEGAPAPVDAPEEAAQSGDLTTAVVAQTEAEPFFQAPPNVLWFTIGSVVVIFFIVIFLVMKMRGRAPRAAVTKPAKTDFFEPAGDGAEISFDDEAPASKKAPGETHSALADEAEVVIEKPGREWEEAPPEIPAERPKPARPQSAFAGLFKKKKRDDSGAAMAVANAPADESEWRDDFPATDAPAPDDSDPADFAPLSEERAPHDFHAGRDAEEAHRLALFETEEARRRALHDADFARRRAEEDLLRIEENRRIAAERELEFERRKLAAAEDLRRDALLGREHAIAQRAGAFESQLTDLRRDLANELDSRFSNLAKTLEARLGGSAAESAGHSADQAAFTQLLNEVDARMTALADKVETRLVASGAGRASPGEHGGGDERVAAISEMIAGRIADQRDALNASLAAMSNRIDAVAGAPQDVKAFREEIASIKQALGERSIGPSAPVVQLSDIVRNALPPDAYELRAVLPNNRKADCLVKLPHPPGPIAIDARFPVEAFHKLRALGGEDAARSESEFRRTALRHIVDIAERLIVPEETAESALMFIPSESMFAELHARFPDVVQDSYRARVWIVSPTTLMATLHTIRAVLRDAHARESADLIHSEAQHVLAEVDALRRRVVALEEDFNKARHDVRDVLSSTDQVYRRAETISNTRRSLSETALDRGSKRIPNVTKEDPPMRAVKDEDADEAGDLWEDEQEDSAEQPPFPLR